MDPKNNYGIWKIYANISGDERVIFSDNLELSDDENGVDIRVSMFFDGTNNNMFNTESRLENKKKDRNEKFDKEKVAVYQEHKGDDSYENDFSNVSRLFQYYKEDITSVDSKVAAIYIEGIATLKDHGDSKSVGITGAGTRGIFDKVEDGCKQLAIRIEKLKGDKDILSLTIDVFGFSRGAAAARQFIYEITKPSDTKLVETGTRQFEKIKIPAREALAEAFKKNGIEFEGEIEIKFAGIFDTVSSYKGIYPLHLEAVGQAGDVLHLTAMDERRDQFELVDITKSKSAKFEKALPGVHTDVGGSCNGSITEKSKNLFYGSIDEIKQEISYYLQDGWFEKESDLTIHQGLGRKYISGERENVKNDYSYIPLHIMKKRATVYNKLKFIKKINDDFEISSELDVISKRLNAYVFEKDKPMVYYTPDEIVEEIKKTVTEERIEEIREKLHKKEKDELMNEFGFTSKSINEPIIVNNNNNMSKVSEIYQQRIKRDNTNIYTPTTPGYEIKFDDQAMRNALLYNYLDKDDYSEYPELQQKINDHQELKKLRKKYFHISHECSFTGGLVSIFDPYSKSIRDKPSRKIEKK